MRAFSLLAVLCLIASSTGCKPAPNDRSVQPGDAELVQKAVAAVSEMDKLRRETMASADGKVFPRPDLGSCPVKYETYRSSTSTLPGQSKEATGFLDIEPWEAGRPDDLMANFSDEIAAIERLGVAYGTEVAQKPGPRMFSTRSDARDKARSEYDRKRLGERADKTKDVNDYELIIDHEVAPKLTSETEFEPGILRGRFYVWDYDKGAIICMARILVLSSEKLRIKVSTNNEGKKAVDEKWAKGMRGDLREQALDQVKSRLYPAGPLPSEDADDAGALDGGGAGAAKDGGSTDAGKAGKTAVRDAGGR